MTQAASQRQAGLRRIYPGGKKSPDSRQGSRKRAKLDMMTGFSGIRPIEKDEGLNGLKSDDYFRRWTTADLPDQGRNGAIDDDQQPVGAGAPATTIPQAPLKTPMEADDIARPKIREGREANRVSLPLRKVASKIRLLNPVLARRLLAASDNLDMRYEDMSTAALELSGDEVNEVDAGQDEGHGRLQFWGTDPPKKTSLTRESSRHADLAQREGGDYELDNLHGYELDGPFPSRGEALEKVVKRDFSQLKEKSKKDEKARKEKDKKKEEEKKKEEKKEGSRRAGGDSHSDSGNGLKDINWKNTLNLVESAVQGHYDPEAVATILDSDYKRTRQLLNGGHTTPQKAAGESVRHGDYTSQAARSARSQGDPPLHPNEDLDEYDGPGADGASAFVDRSKAPLQKSMTPDDVDRPRIRENPEATRSLWAAFKEVLRKGGSGAWNEGKYAVASRDYGDTLEITASIQPRDGIEVPVGNMTISLLNDSPSGRFASVEMNDGLIENRSLEFTMQPKVAGRIASWIMREAVDISKEALEHF
jgi:hypothetical protein